MTQYTTSPLMEGLNAAAAKKVNLLEKEPLRYFMRAVFAGIYLAFGGFVGIILANRFNIIHPSVGNFLYALFFGWGLIMIIYMNGELTTSNMMYTSVAAYNKEITWAQALKLVLVCFIGNFVGSFILAYLVNQTSLLDNVSANDYLFQAVSTKFNKVNADLFLEGILANILVNIAIIGSNRIKGDLDKIVYLIAIIAIFIFFGFEHVIANFGSFSLAKLTGLDVIPGFAWYKIIIEWLIVFVANYIGGGLVMGIGYAWLNKTQTSYVD